jgi:uncharacterized protein YgiM (DUF1202 family)
MGIKKIVPLIMLFLLLSGCFDSDNMENSYSPDISDEHLPIVDTPVHYGERVGIKYQVFVGKLNVRENPTVKSKVIAQLHCGDIVREIMNSSIPQNWLKVKLDSGKIG